MADIDQIGAIVLGALLHPEKAGRGQHISLCGGTYSWLDVVETFNAQGHKVVFNQVPNETFDDLLPGAKNLRASLNYLEAHTYFGPNAEQKIALAKDITVEPLSSLEDWLRKNAERLEALA